MTKTAFSRIDHARFLAFLADEGQGWALMPSAEFAAEGIAGGNIEAWAALQGGETAGVILLARSLSDRDFADGEARCYLYFFLVAAEKRGQGIGSALLRRAIARARELGFREAAIGVEESKPENLRLYRREGFTRLIKCAQADPCTPLPDGTPCCDSFLLLARALYEE